MIDFQLFGGFALRRTDRQANEQTFVIVESLLQLKIFIPSWNPSSK